MRSLSSIFLSFAIVSCSHFYKEIDQKKNPSLIQDPDIREESDRWFDDLHDIGLADTDHDIEVEALRREGFSEDDVYVEYLKSQFLNKYKKRYPQTELSPSQKEALDDKALHYVITKLTRQEQGLFGSVPLHQNNAEVAEWVDFFNRRARRTFAEWLQRRDALEESLRPILKEAGLPPEMIYLAMIESGLDHQARSPARAVGLWQFVEGTARLYGLKVNSWVDERKDPIQSTRAAARYLKSLYGIFQDWHLVFAAYNGGPRAVEDAMRKSGTRDYWSLIRTPHLKRETKQFVPKLLAAIIVGEQREKNGFERGQDLRPPLPRTAVRIKKQLDLQRIAQVIGVPLKTIKKWNPELISGSLPPSSHRPPAGYPLKMPPEYIKIFEQDPLLAKSS
ncbi:MAG: lytic transglycosylase domain-containing protein [Oligoflexales bacterium]|nr:lytic transglycosylase domain-containing protein [Oligoflexales bacterium]